MNYWTVSVLFFSPDGELDFSKCKTWIDTGENHEETVSQAEGYFCELVGVDVDIFDDILDDGYYIFPDSSEVRICWINTVKL